MYMFQRERERDTYIFKVDIHLAYRVAFSTTVFVGAQFFLVDFCGWWGCWMGLADWWNTCQRCCQASLNWNPSSRMFWNFILYQDHWKLTAGTWKCPVGKGENIDPKVWVPCWVFRFVYSFYEGNLFLKFQVVATQIFLEFSSRNLGKIPNLTNIFQMGWNHQLGFHYPLSCLDFLIHHVSHWGRWRFGEALTPQTGPENSEDAGETEWTWMNC